MYRREETTGGLDHKKAKERGLIRQGASGQKQYLNT